MFGCLLEHDVLYIFNIEFELILYYCWINSINLYNNVFLVKNKIKLINYYLIRKCMNFMCLWQIERFPILRIGLEPPGFKARYPSH